MAIKILMPALSPTMKEGTISKWLKKEGDSIEPGDVIAEIETDKAIMEMEATDQGVLSKIVISEGTSGVKVNTVIAFLREEGEEELASEDQTEEVSIQETHKINTSEETDIKNNTELAEQLKEGQDRIIASPLAKRIAKNYNIGLTNIKGTGPGGRIIKRDVLAYASTQSYTEHEQTTASAIKATSDYALIQKHAHDSRALGISDTEPNDCSTNQHIASLASDTKTINITNMRRVIAERLSESKRTIPHFYLSVDCNVEALLKLRKDMNAIEGVKISVNDFIIKAVSLSIKEVPEVNSIWSNEGIIQYSSIDISVAVALSDGLITPILFNTENKSIKILSQEMKDLASRARAGKLKPEEFTGGCFTISNLGMYGISDFIAIINPPQSSILAVGAILEKPIVQNKEVVIGNILSATLSCDHRVIDGAVGAKFINAFKKYMESPLLMLI